MSNLSAFLTMISHSEGTDRAADPYRVCFGFKHTIAELSDHPAITGEWSGEPLDFLGPTYAGLISTAAGKYQITKHTWEALKTALSLHDFSAASQDAAATLLIKQKGALDLVNGGQVADAIGLCHNVWASLPGSTSGQPQKTMASLVANYTSNGGGFA
jgi:muramidase (phage lysozyme)